MSSSRKERAPTSNVGVTTPAKCNDVVPVPPPPPPTAAQEEVNTQQPLIDIEPLSSDRPQQSSGTWERERVRHPYHCFTPQYYTPTPHAEVRVPGLAPTHSYPPTRDRNSYKNSHHPLHPPPQSIHGAVPVPNCAYPHISPYHPAYKQRQLQQQQQQMQWARSGGEVAWPFRLPMEGDNNNDQPYLVHQQHQHHPAAFVHRPFIQQQQPQYDRHRNLSPLAQQQQYINQDSVCPLKEMYQKQQYKYCQPEQPQPPQQHHHYQQQQQARPQVGVDYRTGAAQQGKRVPQPQQPQFNAYVPPFGRFHHEFQQYAYQQQQQQQPLQQDYVPRDQMYHRNYNNNQRQDVYSGFNNYNPQQNQYYAAAGNQQQQRQQQQWCGFGGNVGENYQYQQQQQPSSSPLHQFQQFFQHHFPNKFFKFGNGQYRQTSNNQQQGNNHQYYNSPIYPQQQQHQEQQQYYYQPNMNAAQGGHQHLYNNNYDYFNSSQNDIFVERRKFVYDPVVMPPVNVTVQHHFVTNLFGGTGCPLLLTAPKKRRSTEEKVTNSTNNDVLEINGGYSTITTSSDKWATVQSHSTTASRTRRFAIVASVYRRASLCSDASSMDPAAWMEGDVWRQLLEGGCFNKDITTFSVPNNVDIPDWNPSDINNFTPQWNGTGNRQDEMCVLKARQPDFSVARVDIFDVENPEFNVTACALIPTKIVKDRELPTLSNSKDKFLWTYDPNTASRCLFDDDESDGSISDEEDNLLPFLPLERTFSISDVKSLVDENYECDESQ